MVSCRCADDLANHWPEHERDESALLRSLVENLLGATCQVHAVVKHRCPPAWCYELGRAVVNPSMPASLSDSFQRPT